MTFLEADMMVSVYVTVYTINPVRKQNRQVYIDLGSEHSLQHSVAA